MCIYLIIASDMKLKFMFVFQNPTDSNKEELSLDWYNKKYHANEKFKPILSMQATLDLKWENKVMFRTK